MTREQEARDEILRLNREVVQLADECAFWAYQAKWYYAWANYDDTYDDLPAAKQKEIDAHFEKSRQAENQERLGFAALEPAHGIGS